MRGLDIKNWSLWDWIGGASLVLAALVLALNAALKDAPALASKLPDFLGSSLWAYMPLVLVLITLLAILVRAKLNSRSAVMEREFGLPVNAAFQMAFESPSEFKLLPQHYTVDLTAQLPFVEARFFVVSFLEQPIVLTHVKLTIRVLSASPLEAIPLMQDDFRVQPKSAPIVVFRRNLTDPEIRNLPWRGGWESGSFELLAKATTGDKTLMYGPVSAMVIEGLVRVPPPQQPPRLSDRI